LKHQEQMAVLGRLIASIVHEINNPLDSALNLLFVAQQSANLEEARKYLQLAQEELQRAASITAQGLQFQRQPSAPPEVDIADLLRSVVTLFRSRLDKAGINVKFRYLDSPKLICFPGEIRQAFINLIGNAIDALSEGGQLRIKVRPGIDWRTDRQGVHITIADTGHGMSSSTRRSIYQAFFTTKGSEGSGLGLWVTANIVNKHQGSIHVRSRTLPGSSGTVFRVTFPYNGAEGKTPGLRDESIV
jgi:two-component system, sporulation sensor kinase C